MKNGTKTRIDNWNIDAEKYPIPAKALPTISISRVNVLISLPCWLVLKKAHPASKKSLNDLTVRSCSNAYLILRTKYVEYVWKQLFIKLSII